MGQREIRRTFCQICKCDCGIVAELKDGKVQRIEGDGDNPNSRGQLCVKGRNSLKVLYHKDRLRKPLLNTGQRGRPEWKEISWERALELMKDKLNESKLRYGAESVVFLFGTTSRTLDTSMVKRFANRFGSPNVTQTWSICVGPKMLASLSTFGPPAYPTCDFANANFIMLWGANPLVSYMHRYHGIVEDILKAKNINGAPIVVVDPRKSETARIADYHLPIRPNSDFYLAMGMIQYLIENDLYDHDFVSRYTTGFDELKNSLGDYDLESVSSKTDLSIDRIREVTDRFAGARPASIDRREGILHNVNGLQTARAIAILMTLSGNIDVPGGLIFNPQIKLNDITLRDQLPETRKPFWCGQYPLAADGSGYLAEAILSDQPYPIRSLVVLESNPMLTLPNTGKVIKALKKLDFLVVHDFFLTETCTFADLVLPASTFYEKGEIDAGLLKSKRWVRVRRKIIESLYESKSEAEFIRDLGIKMGYLNDFAFPTEESMLSALSKGSEVGHYASEELERGVFLEEKGPGALRERGFNTASGKIELIPSALRPFAVDVPKPVPGPTESGEYPFFLITGAKVPAFYHSQFRNIQNLKKLRPIPVAEVGSGIAQKAGISDGDLVEIQTQVGKLQIEATIKMDMHPLTVSVPHGWTDRNANFLTDDLIFEPLSGAPMYRGIPCQVTTVRSFRRN